MRWYGTIKNTDDVLENNFLKQITMTCDGAAASRKLAKPWKTMSISNQWLLAMVWTIQNTDEAHTKHFMKPAAVTRFVAAPLITLTRPSTNNKPNISWSK